MNINPILEALKGIGIVHGRQQMLANATIVDIICKTTNYHAHLAYGIELKG